MRRALVEPGVGILPDLNEKVVVGATLYTGLLGQCPALEVVAPALGNTTAVAALLESGEPVDDTPTGEAVAATSTPARPYPTRPAILPSSATPSRSSSRVCGAALSRSTARSISSAPVRRPVLLDRTALEYGIDWRMVDQDTMELIGAACQTYLDGENVALSADADGRVEEFSTKRGWQPGPTLQTDGRVTLAGVDVGRLDLIDGRPRATDPLIAPAMQWKGAHRARSPGPRSGRRQHHRAGKELHAHPPRP